MTIKKGDAVKLDYEGSLDDGTVFDSSKHGDHSHPLEFGVGNGQVIPGFDNAVLGMKVGEEKTFKIEPKDAYGEVDENLVQQVPKSAFPPNMELKVGMTLGMHSPDGQRLTVVVKEIGKDSVKLDMNHPLAGKRLTFKIKILEIN